MAQIISYRLNQVKCQGQVVHHNAMRGKFEA